MVEILLFLGTFCLLFFLPVQFRISYRKLDWNDCLELELSFLHGLLKRKKEMSFLPPASIVVEKKEKESGRWFFYRRSKVKKADSSVSTNSRGWREFLHRYQHFGLGMTLLTYFLPAGYQRWLLVVEDLERKGHFTKFTWITRFGTGEPAETAILSGMLWGVKISLYKFLTRLVESGEVPEIKVIPDFQSARLDIFFDCIFRVKLGYIIIAAFIARFRHRLLKGGIGVGDPSN